MATLREWFALYCKLLKLRQDTCLALTLLLGSKEALIAMMQYMAKLDKEGIQKKEGWDVITTMVVNKAEKVRDWQDSIDPQMLHFS